MLHPKKKTTAKAKSAAKKRPAAAKDHGGSEPAAANPSEKAKKRPASAVESPPKVNKYIYNRDGVWGIKINGKEIFRVGVL